MEKFCKKTLQVDIVNPISANKIMQSPEERLCANILSYATKLNDGKLKKYDPLSPQRRNS